MGAAENPRDRLNQIAKEAFNDALEILQLIELIKRQNTNRINKLLAEAGASDPARAVRNALIARLTTLVDRCYAKTGYDDDKHLRRAFELLKDKDLRSVVAKGEAAKHLAEAEKLWEEHSAGDVRKRVKHFRDKTTAHWADPKPDQLPSYTELFDFAVATTRVVEALARSVGGSGDTLAETRKKHAAAAEVFWKPWCEASGPEPRDSVSQPTFFRVARLTYNDKGRLAERAVLSGQHQSKEEAMLAAKSVAARDPRWKFDDKSGEWRMPGENGRAQALLVEG